MKKGKSPKISVLMSVYNGQEFLEETVQSVLGQTLGDFEFIMVNDGSKDSSLDIIKSFAAKDKRIVIINKENTGLTKSLNTGLRMARGKYVARIDAGDLCAKDRLKVQSDFLDNHPKVVLVGSDVVLIDAKGNNIGYIEYPHPNKGIKKNLCKANVFAHSSLMMRKKVLDKEGFYDEEFRYTQDYELILRLMKKGYGLANIPKKLISYRFDPKSITFAKGKDSKKFLRLAQKKHGIGINAGCFEAILPSWSKLFALSLMKFINHKVLRQDFTIKANGRRVVWLRR